MQDLGEQGPPSCTYLSKNAKQGDPQDEEDEVPNRKGDTGQAENEGDEVERAGHGGNTANHYSVDLEKAHPLVSVLPAAHRGLEGELSPDSPISSRHICRGHGRGGDPSHRARRWLGPGRSRRDAGQ